MSRMITHQTLKALSDDVRQSLASKEFCDVLASDVRDRGTIGVQIALTSDSPTVLRPMQVQSVLPGSWAHGLIHEGDEIVAIGGDTVDESNVIFRAGGLVGSPCLLTVLGPDGIIRDVDLVRSSMIRLQSVEELHSMLSKHQELISNAAPRGALHASFASIQDRVLSLERNLIEDQATAYDRIAGVKSQIFGM